MKKYFIFFILFLVPFSLLSTDKLVIIVHPEIPITKITRTELQEYFMKRKKFWSNGLTVRPVDWGEGQLPREIFLKTVLKKTSRDMAKFWIGQKLYTGDYAPIQLTSDEVIIDLVSNMEGSISYVFASSLNTERLSQVKVVDIDGE